MKLGTFESDSINFIAVNDREVRAFAQEDIESPISPVSQLPQELLGGRVAFSAQMQSKIFRGKLSLLPSRNLSEDRRAPRASLRAADTQPSLNQRTRSGSYNVSINGLFISAICGVM